MKSHYAFPNTYLVFDLETSGLDPKKDFIVEIGWMLVREGQVIVEESRLLNIPGMFISPEATAIHGITTQQCCDEGVSVADALAEFLPALLMTKGVVITHNGSLFDLLFLANCTMDANFLTHLARVRHIDTAAIFKAERLRMKRGYCETQNKFHNRVLSTRNPLKFNLRHVCDELGVDRTQFAAHRAAGDVAMTNEIYKRMCL